MKHILYFLSIILVTAAVAFVAHFWFIPVHLEIEITGWPLVKAIGAWLFFWISIDVYVSARSRRKG